MHYLDTSTALTPLTYRLKLNRTTAPNPLSIGLMNIFTP